MSNVWYYNLLISSPTRFSDVTVSGILHLAESIGYSARNPVTNQILITRRGGIDSLELDSLDRAVMLLGEEGGLLQLWKGHDTNIDLWFDLGGIEKIHSTNMLGSQKAFGEIAICVEDCFLRLDLPENRIIAEDIQQLFVHLCETLTPVYGYSADENVTEQFMDELLHIHEDIKAMKKPPVLFWLNYLSSEYVDQVGLDIFQHLRGKIIEVSVGTLVLFFDYPWEVKVNALQTINDEWHRLS